jgi:hypothetical protein
MAGMTENEQKQQLSIAYVHAVAARAGYACEGVRIDDDSIDVQVAARGRIHNQSVVRSPKIDIQLKATTRPALSPDRFPFPLPVKNYNDLRLESLVPRLLVVLLLPQNNGLWLEQTEEQMISRHCAYWSSLLGEPETSNTRTVTVQMSRSRQFTVDGLHELMTKVSKKEAL